MRILAILDAIAASTFPGPLKIGLVAMVFVAIPVMLIHLGSWALTWILARKAEDQMDALIPRRGNVDRKSLWHYIKRLKVQEFWLLIKLRLLSVMRLASSIFMNRVRQLSLPVAARNGGTGVAVYSKRDLQTDGAERVCRCGFDDPKGPASAAWMAERDNAPD